MVQTHDGEPQMAGEGSRCLRAECFLVALEFGGHCLRGLTRSADFKERASDCIKRKGFSFIVHLCMISGQDAAEMCTVFNAK